MQSIDEFARGTEHLEDREHLAQRLARGDRLRIKFGVDPTAPDLHLGHTVPMRRLRTWQQSGHLPVIIIGDWTARIGDPSGRSETRPPLSADEVEANSQTYLAQLFLILDRDHTEVRRQTEWFDRMGLADVLKLCASRTTQQILQRSDFTERMRAEHAIGIHELLYPLLQGYDSVAVDADLEIGGTDQLFNLLAARQVQRWYGKPEQDVATFPLLEGVDGVRKMSKSYGNYIGIAEPPEEQYGKAMSIPDGLIVRYLTLATDAPEAEIADWARRLQADEVNPRDAKAFLARAIVRQFHGDEAAQRVEQRFREVHAKGGLPEDMPQAALARDEPWNAVELAEAASRIAGSPLSRSEIRRLLQQNGLNLYDEGGTALFGPGGQVAERLEPDRNVAVVPGMVLRIGKRTFVRLVAAP
jgi:tyrosyl-tRNA synthetase